MIKTKKLFVWPLTLVLLLSLGVGAIATTSPPAASDLASDPIYEGAGDIGPGGNVSPTFQLFGTEDRDVNLRLTVSGGEPVDLAVTDGDGGSAFTGTILDGEELWATMTLKPGFNEFLITNNSGNTISYELTLWDIDPTPYGWSGVSDGTGTWRSHIQLNFPTSGLYQFDFDLASGRYQFLLDDDYIQKTVQGTETENFYVQAGIHDLYIMPYAASGADWSMSISGPVATVDTLPCEKDGRHLWATAAQFNEEWLPINLATASETNFELTLTGGAANAIDVYVYDGLSATLVDSISDVYGGETVWWTSDLPSGLNRIQIVTDAANTGSLAYDLTIHAKPTVDDVNPASWAGKSLAAGNQSQVRFEAEADALYDFAFGLNSGRFQFLVESDDLIQKTVETPGTVRYFLPAGTHTLTIVQDTQSADTDWDLTVTITGDSHDALPYQQAGGDLGGTGNDFEQEWLPIELASAAQANFHLTLDGDLADGLVAKVFQGAAAVYTSPVVYGGETFWWTAELAAGINQVQFVTEAGNTAELAYDLTISDVPGTPTNWSGVAKGSAGNPIARVNIPTAGTYRVGLDTPNGFAQLMIGEVTLSEGLAPKSLGHTADFDVVLAAGAHDFKVLQSANYPTTTWTVDVQATAPDEEIANFAGSLDVGEQVEPQLPLFGTQDLEVNFVLQVTGAGQMDLDITDGGSGTAFSGTALAGETVWGTAILKPGQNTFSFDNTGTGVVNYDLTVYTIQSTSYAWDGVSLGAGDWDSHITLNFPNDSLYRFDYDLASGRYQFLVDDEYIQKTTEGLGDVYYHLPAGDHTLKIVPDRSLNTTWSLDVSVPGDANDTLPYAKDGGHLWATAAQFNEEWLPLNLATAAETNFELTLTGGSANSADVFVYDGMSATLVDSITGVYGGETVWWTSDLPAGLNRIQIVTDAANTGSLTYDLTVHAKPTVNDLNPASWAGKSLAAGNQSQVRFEADADALYDFAFGLNSGRFQFLVESDDLIQKTVEAPGTVRYFLPAGTHTLTLVQDTQSAETDWDLTVSITGDSHDALPYHQTGGDLGGAGNDFEQEWLPIELASSTQANFRLALTGDLADGLVAKVFQGATEVYTSPVVYGGEIFWWTAPLAAGVNQVQFVTEAGNAAQLQYDLTITDIPTVHYQAPYTWSGIAKSSGGNSVIDLNVPIDATYRIAVNLPVGFANVLISPMGKSITLSPNQSYYEFDAALTKGEHLFKVQQDPAFSVTEWEITVTLPTPEAYFTFLPLVYKNHP